MTSLASLLALNDGWRCAGGPGITTALAVTALSNDGVRAALDDVDALLCELLSRVA